MRPPGFPERPDRAVVVFGAGADQHEVPVPQCQSVSTDLELAGAGRGVEQVPAAHAVRADVQPFLDSAASSTVNMPIAEGWTGKVADINKTVNDLYLDKTDVAAIAAAMDKIGNDK